MSDFKPSDIYREIIAAGEDWADKKSAYDALDDNTKSVLADITSGYMKTSKSKAEAEMHGLAADEYKAHLRSVQDARRAFLRAQVKYDSLRLLAELRRSQESTKRAEMNLR